MAEHVLLIGGGGIVCGGSIVGLLAFVICLTMDSVAAVLGGVFMRTVQEETLYFIGCAVAFQACPSHRHTSGVPVGRVILAFAKREAVVGIAGHSCTLFSPASRCIHGGMYMGLASMSRMTTNHG